MKPIAQMSSAEAIGVKYILMDIDDTLTRNGKLPAVAYAALWDLKAAGLRVIPVTGRPAGWCDLIAREWPVDAVIGENGALAFWEAASDLEAVVSGAPGGQFDSAVAARSAPGTRRPVLKQEFHPNAVRNDHPVLTRVRERALAEVPGLRVAKDQFARLFDLALDFAEEEPVLSLAEAEQVRVIAEEEGAMAKVSSIHVNVWMGTYDKLSMAERFLMRHFGWLSGSGDREVVFVGDSPNDEPMFARFPLACAVANINRYQGHLIRYPTFVATAECGEGFAEIAAALLAKRR
jgi:hydroxymethylpyrimidine pyrophosphatase-like HAD family hydrolase